ncbi:MAG: lamin tail domain-containing protein [Bacteroides sp.]|nr:lamin tail domain-containing protein [Bacteroides sp.]
MNNKKLGFLVILCLLSGLTLRAQNVSSLRINEVLTLNEDNYEDDYGKKNAWIEIFNTSFGTVDIGGCFLTNDKNNPTKYPIPKGDVLTSIPPRQHVLFWADGIPSRGTFHLSFKLDAEKENYIALYDANGKTLIDEVIVPILPADHSYALEKDGKGRWILKGAKTNSFVTPSTNNITLDKNEKVEKFKEQDKHGFGMSATAMLVVFFSLLLLYLAFKTTGRIAMNISKKNAIKMSKNKETESKELTTTTGEEIAAVVMALHEHLGGPHDYEDMVLTMNEVKRRYSPWSSKIYNMRQL